MRAIRHIPQASQLIPCEYRDQFVLSDADLAVELLAMTDAHADVLFGVGPERDVAFPVSRLLVDAERFADDTVEAMAARGMGVLYTTTHACRPLRRPVSEAERVASVMIEVRRDLYMDEATGVRLASFESSRQRLTAVLAAVESDWLAAATGVV